MKIASVKPPPPPTIFTMTFQLDDGWAIVAALREYAEHHPDAYGKEEWRRWARELDTELRR